MISIDTLGVAKIKHLQKIHDLKSYRNACYAVKKLEGYIHEIFVEKEKVIYLNKAGREMIGSTKEVKKTPLIEHSLLRNDVYLYFNCPVGWKTEHAIEIEKVVPETLEMKIKGLKPVVKKKIISDATFIRNGYFHLIEIDNTRNMSDNKKKIALYTEVMPFIKQHIPVLLFFTTSDVRKKRLEAWCKGKGFRYEVKTFKEIT